MKDRQVYTFFLISVIFAGIISLSPAISQLTNNVIIPSAGKISGYVTARSGSARDIQAAVNQVVATGGKGNVYIPEGTFNFVEVDQPWVTVDVPAGINIFGAPTERDADGQVIEWKTVLVMPYEVSAGPDSSPSWFSVEGNGDPTKSFRFSDIKLVGWRYFNNASTAMSIGVFINRVLDFRFDHCYFQDLANSAVTLGSYPLDYYNRGNCSGVIDHCKLVNTYGDPGFLNYDERTLGYGIGLRRWASDIWDPKLTNIIGHYTSHTVFIEDNYFSKWRHCVCSNDGFHYVFRRNIVEGGYGIGEVDGHGSYADESAPYAVGTRCIEIYNNTFRNPDTTWNDHPWALNLRGGASIVFNNTIQGYYGLLDFNNDWGNYEPYVPKCAVNQTYIWNNNLGSGTLIHYNADSEQNVNYFLRAPNLQQDGFEYTPYAYPHPLTQES